MTESATVLDFQEFRTKKQISLAVVSTPAEPKISSQQLDSKIENIKRSIQRINALMAELKSISNKQEQQII